MRNEDMLKLRLQGKTHAEIAKLSTEQGRKVSRQMVVKILKRFPVTRKYTLDNAENAQNNERGGLKGLLDKIVLKVKKFV